MSTPEELKTAVGYLQEARGNVLLAMSVCGDEDKSMCQDMSDDLADLIAFWSGQPNKVVETKTVEEPKPMLPSSTAAGMLSDAFDSMQEVCLKLDPKMKPQLKFILANLDTLIKEIKAGLEVEA